MRGIQAIKVWEADIAYQESVQEQTNNKMSETH